MKIALLAATMLLGATAAQAVTFYTVPGAPDPGAAAGESVLVDFEGTDPATFSGSYTILTGNVGGAAAPAGDATNYFAVPDVNLPTPGVATIDFSGYLSSNRDFRSLSFYWGSVDQYNTLEVLRGDGSVLFTLVGNQISNPANGNQSIAETNQRVFLRFANGEDASALRFTSTERAFEIDDIAGSAVPEPQTWALLLAGFGMVGHAVRRRRQLASVAA